MNFLSRVISLRSLLIRALESHILILENMITDSSEQHLKNLDEISESKSLIETLENLLHFFND